MENIILRQFENRDAKEVYDLHIIGLKQSDTFIDDLKARENLDQDFKDVKRTYIDTGGEFLVVTIDEKIVGMGALKKIDTETAEIKRMRVEPRLQGQGIGKLILDKLIEKAKMLGYKKLILDVALKQKVAQHLYESRNFKETKHGEIYGQETMYYQLKI